MFFASVAVVMLISALGVVLRGWVLTLLWAWFVVPTFGMPPLAIAPAIGCALVVGYLTHQPQQPEERAESIDDVFGRLLAHTTLAPLLALVFGWIVKQWM